MRTTLTIDDALLRQKGLYLGKLFKQVVNDTLRVGLGQAASPWREAYRCPTFSIGALASAVNLTKAYQLAAALEDGDWIGKLRRGR
jgi:hypothetical protein